jgi:hypothetical protein
MLFLDSDTCAERGEVIYFCQGFLPCIMPSMMDDGTNGWMNRSCDEKSFTKNDHDVLYYM